MPRHRSHGDDRSRSSPPRSLRRRSSDDGGGRRPSLPPLSKAEILSEAGRLAAEYLVSKGILPADSLPEKCLPLPGPRRSLPKPRARETPMPPPESRMSAFPGRRSRRMYGDDCPSPGRSRRGYNDDDEHEPSRKHSGSKRKMEYDDRRRNGSDWRDWGRPRGRDRRWEDRSRGYPDRVDGDDDFAPGFRRGWRGGFREVESSISRVAADEVHSRSDVTADSRSETNHELTGDSRGLSLEAGEEVRSCGAGDLEKDLLIENSAALPGGVEDGLAESEHDKEVLNLSCFAKVPTKPRSSLAQKSAKTDQVSLVSGKAFEACSEGASKNLESFSCNTHEDRTDSVKCQSFDDLTVHSIQPMEESLNPQHESHQSPRGMVVDERMVDSAPLHVDKREELKNEGESTPLRVSQENVQFQLLNSKAPQSDEGSIVAVDQQQQTSDCQPDSVVDMDTENQHKPLLFKTLDLNLVGSPEITEIAHVPVPDKQPSSLSAGNHSEDFGLSLGSASNANDGGQHSQDKKVVPVIDLEDDYLAEGILSSSSKPKSEAIPSSPENVTNHTPETNDLSTIQDGYNLEITQLLGGNISRCPSVQADLSNLQDEMSLYNAEGFSGEDDPIYVSLGEFPMGLMDVWDQPPQDYGKLF